MKKLPKDQSSARQTRTVAEGVRKSSTVRSSAVMFAGTLVSRILGFIRQWLLVLAIGGFGVADAFNTANTLPNTLYNLVAGGVLNAILVPWIVRALMHNKDGDQRGTDQVNALLTLASMLLLALTVLTMILVGPLVLLFSAHISPDLLPLTVVFALWCLPQILFYGLYALWGQVLNSLSNFGPYMWAPVLNNLVGIAGLGVFVYLYGAAPATDHNVAAWDFPRVALLAGSMTLGIAVQALVLVIALRYFGFYLKLNFHFRGLGLRQTSKVAGWAFAALLATTVSNVVVTRVSTAANGWGIAHDTFVVSSAIYGYANMLYMLPQSLITTSITTAIFTKMAYRVTHGDMAGLAEDYSLALRLSGMFTVGLAALMIVAALPLTFLTASNLPPTQANAMALLLAVFCLGIPFQGVYSTNSRVFYALEDTRPQFLITLPLMLCTVAAGTAAMAFAPARYWVYACAGGEAIGLAVAALLGVWALGRRGIPAAVFWQCLVSFIRFTAAATAAGTLTWFTLRALGMGAANTWTVGSHLRQGFLLCLVAGVVMSVSYVLFLWLLRAPEVRAGAKMLGRKFGFLARLTGGSKSQSQEASPTPGQGAPGALPAAEQPSAAATPSPDATPSPAAPLPPTPQPGVNGTAPRPVPAPPTEAELFVLPPSFAPTSSTIESTHQEVPVVFPPSFPPPTKRQKGWEQVGDQTAARASTEQPAHRASVPPAPSPDQSLQVDSELELPTDAISQQELEEMAGAVPLQAGTDSPLELELPPDISDLSEQELVDMIDLEAELAQPTPLPSESVAIEPVTSEPVPIEPAPNEPALIEPVPIEQPRSEPVIESAPLEPEDTQSGAQTDREGDVSQPTISQATKTDPQVAAVHQSLASRRERRQRESRLLMGVFGVLLVVALIVSCLLLAGTRSHQVAKKDDSLQLQSRSTVAAAPQREPQPLVITGVQAANPQGDNYDYPQLAGNVIDSNPQTMWRTAPLITSRQRPGHGYALIIDLEPGKQVREVRVSSPCQGGTLELQAGNGTLDNLGQGQKLGEQPYSDQIVFRLEQGQELSQLVLWTNVLPKAPGGGNQIIISEVQVLG